MLYDTKIQNYKNKKLRITKYRDTRIKSDGVAMDNDKANTRGKLTEEECFEERQNYNFKVKRRIYELATVNDFDYFLTFTFDPKYSTNEQRFQEMSKWLKSENRRANRNGSELKYIVVPELHKNGLVHFHGLIGGTIELKLEKNKNGYMSVKNWNKRGFSSVEQIKDKQKVANYISKYISKNFDENNKAVAKFKKRYWSSKNLERGTVAYEEVEQDSDMNEFIQERANYTQELKNCVVYELDEEEAKEFLDRYEEEFNFFKSDE